MIKQPVIDKQQCQGFTLMELMIVLAIISFALTAAYLSWREGAVREKTTIEKLAILGDIRLIGLEMMREARNSNRFYIFTDFPASVNLSGQVISSNQVSTGGVGNYLVLEKTLDGDVFTRVGYYLDSEGALIKYEEFNNSSGTPPLPQSKPANAKTVLEEVEGEHTNGNLFYNYASQTILVQGNFKKTTPNVAAGSTQEIRRTFTFKLQPLNN